MRIAVFVDGFNLFYALRSNRARWLDLALLSDNLVRRDRYVIDIHYFTARVDGKGDSDRPRRQNVYLNAIQRDARVRVYFGSFLTKEITRPVERLLIPGSTLLTPETAVYLPPGEHEVVLSNGVRKRLVILDKSHNGVRSSTLPPVFASVFSREEKGSDVNLATQLLNRGWKDEYDQALILSNDSDLCEPIQIVREELRKEVTVCYARQNPRQTVSSRLARASTGVLNIRKSLLRKCQFPTIITLESGVTINKPTGW